MKYRIKRACGHEETVELFGPAKQRDWLLRKEQSRNCLACTSASTDLVGTPKQVAWAEQIRARKLAELEKLVDELKSRFEGHPDLPRVLSACESVRCDLAQQKEAKWWIEHCNMLIRQEVEKRLAG